MDNKYLLARVCTYACSTHAIMINCACTAPTHHKSCPTIFNYIMETSHSHLITTVKAVHSNK